MKSSQLFLAIALFSAGAVRAGQIDMDDPRRAVGREDDIRVDAVLIDDTVSSGSAIGVTYQVHNLTSHPIALAEKLCTASYDAASRTITVAIGSEVPACTLRLNRNRTLEAIPGRPLPPEAFELVR